MKLDSAVFYSHDLNLVVPFYRDILGFEVDYVQEHRFASFKFINGKLGIKEKKEAREIPGSQTVFIETKDIDGLYQKLRAKGVTLLKELTHEDWATNFSLLDPDGNKVQFVSRH